MAAYQKFSDVLRKESGPPPPPKPAKASKGDAVLQGDIRTLGGLGALGGDQVNTPTSLSAHPPTALASLAQTPRISSQTIFANAWGDSEDERAAILEYDASAPRAWTEALAWLDPTRPPHEVLANRWLLFIEDCGRFLDAGWADRAAALGWGPRDLFGCDRYRPLARIDHAGLLWLLNGRKLVALTRNTATIETSTGARQTYYRRSIEKGRVVLAWELGRVLINSSLGSSGQSTSALPPEADIRRRIEHVC